MSTFLLRKGRVSEDALTGLVADIATWWPEEALTLLARARRFDGNVIGVPMGVSMGHEGELIVGAWPRWQSGEPDLVLEFRGPGRRSLLIVEAKLGAEKSGSDDRDASPDPATTKDQLAKYHRDAAASSPTPARVDVVYLTHHVSAPVDELRASHRAMKALKDGALYWLSWRDVEHAIRLELLTADGARARALRSLAAVLAQEGFASFRGSWRRSNRDSLAPAPRPVFWRGGYRWRGPRKVPPAKSRAFWEKGRTMIQDDQDAVDNAFAWVHQVYRESKSLLAEAEQQLTRAGYDEWDKVEKSFGTFACYLMTQFFSTPEEINAERGVDMFISVSLFPDHRWQRGVGAQLIFGAAHRRLTDAKHSARVVNVAARAPGEGNYFRVASPADDPLLVSEPTDAGRREFAWVERVESFALPLTTIRTAEDVGRVVEGATALRRGDAAPGRTLVAKP